MSKFTKKFDRAFQWAGERMGNEARTGTTEEFKMLETEMALRFDGKSPSHLSPVRPCARVTSQ